MPPEASAKRRSPKPVFALRKGKNTMDAILLIVLVAAILALSGWGYGYYYTRPVPGDAVAPGPVAGPSPFVNMVGVLGLILLVGFVIMWATGWHFGFQAAPPP